MGRSGLGTIRLVGLLLHEQGALLIVDQIIHDPPVDGEDKSSKSKGKNKEDGPGMSLSEIGPRFVLVPVKIFEGSFGGATIYENKGECPLMEDFSTELVLTTICRMGFSFCPLGSTAR
jgi:hypothetical protein